MFADDEGADDDSESDESSTSSEDTDVQPDDEAAAESQTEPAEPQPEPESQVVWFLKVFPLLTIFRTVSLSFVVTFGTFMAIDEMMIFFWAFNVHPSHETQTCERGVQVVCSC